MTKDSESSTENSRENDTRPVVVSVKNVAKTFHLPKEHSSELKQAVINFLHGQKGYTDLKVLRDVSFDVRQGDFFGIVGRNGSGKSTLLKLLAGIYQPTRGEIKTVGKIVPFIELGVGFNPELTGRENVYMNGAMLGFSNDEVDAMYDDIVGFAELPEFMDQKLKNYSSGMQVRLAFSIAIKAQGDILILDEVLAVGDEAFQRKCNDFFAQIKKDKTKTVILVTHSMGSVREYCNKAILIENGKITESGSPEVVANQYTVNNLIKEIVHQSAKELPKDQPNIRLKPVSKQVLTSHERFICDIDYFVPTDMLVTVAISVFDDRTNGAAIVNDGVYYPDGKWKTTSSQRGHYTFRYTLPLELFNDRDLTISASLFQQTETKYVKCAFTHEEEMLHFAIRSSKHNKDSGILKLKGEWKEYGEADD